MNSRVRRTCYLEPGEFGTKITLENENKIKFFIAAPCPSPLQLSGKAPVSNPELTQRFLLLASVTAVLRPSKPLVPEVKCLRGIKQSQNPPQRKDLLYFCRNRNLFL